MELKGTVSPKPMSAQKRWIFDSVCNSTIAAIRLFWKHVIFILVTSVSLLIRGRTIV